MAFAQLTVTGDETPSYAENDTRGVATYNVSGATVSWDLSGTDNLVFSISASGVLTFNNPPNFELPDDDDGDNIYQVTVEASNGNLTGTLDVTVTVTDQNEPPVWTYLGIYTSGALVSSGTEEVPIVTKDVSIEENATDIEFTFMVTDPDDDSLSVYLPSLIEDDKGYLIYTTFNVSTNGRVTVRFPTPPDYENSISVGKKNIYEITFVASSSGVQVPLTVNINVTNVDEPPVANEDAVTINEDTFVDIAVLENDSVDAETLPLSVSAVTTPSNGTAEITEGSTTKVTYTPNDNYHGTDTFSYTVSDGADPSRMATATVTMTVASVNDPPVTVVDEPVTTENVPIVIDVLNNDEDVDSELDTETTLIVSAVGTPTAPSNGKAEITTEIILGESTTKVIYTPNKDYLGTDTFSYTVSDGTDTDTATATGTVNVTINEGSHDATLSGLTISNAEGAELQPSFNSETTSYEVDVVYTVTNVQVTPTTANDNATVTVNETIVASNSRSGDITLTSAAATRITVEVTAQDRRTTKTYIIEVFHPPNGPIVHFDEQIGAGFIGIVRTIDNINTCTDQNEAICPTNKSFTRFIFNDAKTDKVRFRVIDTSYYEIELVDDGTITNETGVITVNTNEFNGWSEPINLDLSQVNNIWVTTGTEHSITSITTCFKDVDLSDLEVKSGDTPVLQTEFESDETQYTATVENAVESVTVTPTLTITDSCSATITINGIAVDSGNASVIPLEVGTVSVPVVFTNGSYTKTYTIEMTREELVDIDEIRPTVEISSDVVGPISGPFEVTITLSEAVTGFDQSKIMVTNGSVTKFYGSGTSYTIEITPEGSGEVRVRVDENAIEDQAGNGNQAAELFVGLYMSMEPLELTVSFASAEYTIKEGGKARIEVRVSPAADRRVEVPLEVTLQGGATSENYSGVPEVIVFEVGSNSAMIEVAVLADEVNDSGKGIRLSFGALPEGVSVGEISETIVHFTQYQTPGMLAVIARSMGESAQTAIQGRFERYRQWRRLRPSGGGGSTQPAPNEAFRVSRPVLSSDPSASGFYTGSATRYGTDLRESLRQDRLSSSGIGDSLPGSGMREQELSLAGTSFELPLGEQENEKSWVPVLWGQGDLQSFNGDLRRLGMTYRGGLDAAHIGLDLYANEKMLAGLSFMRSWGDMDYNDNGVDGVLGSRMDTVHPYLYWQPSERVSVWGISGLGRGQVDVTELGQAHDFDADFRMFAAGVRTVLNTRGNNEWSLRADAFTAQLETDASGDIVRVSGEAHRGRLVLEWAHDRELSVGRHLSLKIEAGGRWDGGDADRGAGMETGFRLGYLDANRGLDVALYGRGLVVHETDYQDWGVGVQASWDPGERQRGLRVSVNSSLGQDGGGRTTLWNNTGAVTRPSGNGGGHEYGLPVHMESEVAYGAVNALGRGGLLTPYSRMRWAGQGREISLGIRWSGVRLPLEMELEGVRRESRMGPADLAVSLRMSISF